MKSMSMITHLNDQIQKSCFKGGLIIDFFINSILYINLMIIQLYCKDETQFDDLLSKDK